MIDGEEFIRLLRAEPSDSARLASFVGLLARETGLGTEGMTVVGGSAIEIYTEGAYVSEDIDLLVEAVAPATAALKLWGFKHEGKLWVCAELGLVVDLMNQSNTGSRRLTRVVATRYGQVRLGSIEDLVLKRLLEARYWSQPTALAHAILLIRRYGPTMDWSYVAFHAKSQKIEDLVERARSERRT